MAEAIPRVAWTVARERLVPVVVALALFAATSSGGAQSSTGAARRFTGLVSGGMSVASRLPDAHGGHLELGVRRALGHGFNFQLEAAGHSYGDVPIFRCLIQDAGRCYDSIDRRVIAGIVNAVYEHPLNRASVYLISGAGVYRSHRVARGESTCDVTVPCTIVAYSRDIRATQAGVNGGIGTQLRVLDASLFVDVRAHFVVRTSPKGGPSNDYMLLPFTVGIRL